MLLRKTSHLSTKHLNKDLLKYSTHYGTTWKSISILLSTTYKSILTKSSNKTSFVTDIIKTVCSEENLEENEAVTWICCFPTIRYEH